MDKLQPLTIKVTEVHRRYPLYPYTLYTSPSVHRMAWRAPYGRGNFWRNGVGFIELDKGGVGFIELGKVLTVFLFIYLYLTCTVCSCPVHQIQIMFYKQPTAPPFHNQYPVLYQTALRTSCLIPLAYCTASWSMKIPSFILIWSWVEVLLVLGCRPLSAANSVSHSKISVSTPSYLSLTVP